MDIRKLQRVIVDALEDVKAQDIQVFNTEEITSLFDRVIIASGTSNRQTRALASSVRDAVKAAGHTVRNPEGEDTGEWVLVDCGDAVVHIMQPTIRAYYRLEELWGAKPVRVKLGSPKPAMPGTKTAKSAASKKTSTKSAPKAPAKPAAKTAAKKTPARKTTARPAVKTTRLTGGPGAARKPAAKSPAAKSAKPATTSRGATRKATLAKKSPARKTGA